MAKGSHYVFSTIANDQKYQNYSLGAEGQMPIPTSFVYIKGGAGVANDRLVTPLGVVTEISDDDLVELEKNGIFRLHRDAGFLIVRPRSADPEKVAGDMADNDKSAPLTPADFADAPPSVGLN